MTRAVQKSLRRALVCLERLISEDPKVTFYLYSADLNTKNTAHRNPRMKISNNLFVLEDAYI